MKPSNLTVERLREALDYNENIGVFTWRIETRGHRRKPGDLAGHADRHGYILISVDGQRYQASRLAFLYMTGRWPMPECDHIDGNPANNRFDNLREADRVRNLCNKRVQSNNKLGMKGAYLHSPGIWRARLKTNGKMIECGIFNCPAAARFAYIIAADIHFGKFAANH